MCAMGGTNMGGVLLRPATYLEEVCEMGHLNDSLLTGYAMRLKSVQPLTLAQVKTALTHLRRQVPCLRMSFCEDGGVTWLQESADETIDLEMVNHDAVDDVLTAVSGYRYRSRTGPLWCVKVMAPHPPTRPAMMTGQNISRPDTGLGTPSPLGDDIDPLLPRPDTGLGHHPSERYDCMPLMPGEVIAVPIQEPNRCVILPAPVPFPDPDRGHEQHYDPLMRAVQGAEGGNISPSISDYGAGPSGYGGPHADQEEVYTSGGSGQTSSCVSPSEDPYAPPAYHEEIDHFNMKSLGEGSTTGRPRSRPRSNPSFPSPYPGYRDLRSLRREVPTAATAGSEEEALEYKIPAYVSEEEAAGAAAAMAAATAVAPKDVGSSQSSVVGTSSSASPAFLDTGSSSPSSSPRRGPSPPSLEALGVVGGSFDCVTNVVLGLHQGIADGFSAMRICGRLVKLLNDAVGEVEIDDSVPLEENSVSEFREMLSSRNRDLTDSSKRDELKAAMEERNNWESSMSGVFAEGGGGGGGAIGGRRGRRVRHRNTHDAICFDSITTTRFLEKCRTEGVGVLAAFSALANISLMDVLTARDINKNTYSFFSSHGVDVRQYSGAMDSAYLMGCLVAPIHISTSTPLHAADNFWDFARIFESDFMHTLSEDQALMEVAMMDMYPPTTTDYDEMFSEPLPRMKDYYTSYLGDVTPLITEGGPHVTVEYVECTMSRHKLGYACCHVLHIFRGGLCIALNFSSRYLTTELGKEYMSNVYRRFNEVI